MKAFFVKFHTEIFAKALPRTVFRTSAPDTGGIRGRLALRVGGLALFRSGNFEDVRSGARLAP